MNRTLHELLNRFETDLPENILSGRILKINIDKEKEELKLSLEFDEYINDYDLFSAEKQMSELLETKITIVASFIPECYTNGVVSQTLFDTASQIPMLNGIMNSCETELSGDTLKITLKNGGIDILEESNFKAIYTNIIETKFNKKLNIEIEGVTEFSLEDFEEKRKQ